MGLRMQVQCPNCGGYKTTHVTRDTGPSLLFHALAVGALFVVGLVIDAFLSLGRSDSAWQLIDTVCVIVLPGLPVAAYVFEKVSWQADPDPGQRSTA